MNKFWIIASHTYLSRLKTKMFYISTILVLAFIMLMANFDSIIESFSGEGEHEIAVIDESEGLYDTLESSVADKDWEITQLTSSIEDAKQAVINEEYSALVTLHVDENGLPEATFYANNITDSQLVSDVQQSLQQLKVRIATEQLGIEQAQIMDIFSPIPFEKISLDSNSKSEEELNQARGIVYVMLMLLYIAVLMYGNLIATDVATEKSSRVMEILVSSVSPVTHMFAKILGIALLGMTQVAIFILVGFAMLQSRKSEVGGMLESFGLENISTTLILYGVLFFLLGYLLYATLAAMLGSIVSRVEEVNQVIIPMTFLIVIAFLLSMFGMGVPDSTVVTIGSYIPFFTPMLMFVRVGLLDIAMWEVLLSVGIMVATILLFAFIGAKVYRGGVLLYDKSTSFKDIKKALQLTKKG
ncbi:ABC transporter permease [Ornithinibacillus scapharcae]|uniref:ABC transporter permease n=1 Tax=Ornithinibacillus scapharcae TaxID=1147159 RepID=UPI000225B7B5|nr:ABC transporter permease [Ornithinibacillus scapharcae]